MARYIADQDKTVFLLESGTYANTSGPGFWPGLVTGIEIENAENLIQTRYLGTATRNLDVQDQGPLDVTATLTYAPQDMKVMFWAIGSVTDVSGTVAVHNATEINTDSRQNVHTSGTLNPPKSWTIENSKQAPGTGANFIRTIRGAVPNTTTLTVTQGERVTIEQEFIGQSISFGSGTTTSVTEKTIPSYLWSDGQLTIAGSTVPTTTEVVLEINQNIQGNHYVNGSRTVATPFPGNRDYTLTVNTDLNNPEATRWFRDLFKGGSSFNAQLDLNADNRGQTGSQHTQFAMSGCRISEMEIPSLNEGVTEATVIITPESISAKDWTNGATQAEYAKV